MSKSITKTQTPSVHTMTTHRLNLAIKAALFGVAVLPYPSGRKRTLRQMPTLMPKTQNPCRLFRCHHGNRRPICPCFSV